MSVLIHIHPKGHIETFPKFTIPPPLFLGMSEYFLKKLTRLQSSKVSTTKKSRLSESGLPLGGSEITNVQQGLIPLFWVLTSYCIFTYEI